MRGDLRRFSRNRRRQRQNGVSDCRKLTNINGNAVMLLAYFAKVQVGHPHRVSHSGLLEPRGTSTVLKDPGVFDKTPWSVMP